MSAADDSPEVLTIRYQFDFPNGSRKNFAIALDGKNLQLVPEKKEQFPDWAKLSYFKCANCPLSEQTQPYCPAAASIAGPAEEFSKMLSYEEVAVTIETEARHYTKQTTVQKGLSSLVGLYMVTSGCPIMGKLRPMVRHHLPFANLAETVYRVISMYLLAQYLIARRGKEPDWKLEKLAELYKDIHTVNTHFSQRLLHVVEGDANLNALAILDIFAQTVSFAIDEQMMETLEQVFQPYLE